MAKSKNEKEASKVEKNRGQFQKGKPKTGGRQKGTPNKKTLEFAEALGDFNPVVKLINICNSTEDKNLIAQICIHLIKYLYPQRKAVDMNLQNENDVPIIMDNIK